MSIQEKENENEGWSNIFNDLKKGKPDNDTWLQLILIDFKDKYELPKKKNKE